MRSRWGLLLTIAGLLGGVRAARAQETVALDALWSEVRAHSPEAKASNRLQEAEALAATRLSRHWLPRLRLDARLFGTNGPADSFLGLLAQREIRATDLSPDALNEPPARVFGQGALRAEWLFYEGGGPSARAEGAARLARQRGLEVESVLARTFMTTTVLFGSALALEAHRRASGEVAGTLEKLLAGYEVGSAENPLGRSGLLGMRALTNRVEASVAMDEARRKAALAALGALAGRDEGWEPAPLSFDDFAMKHLTVPEEEAPGPRTLALQAEADAAATEASAQGAALLPAAGLFGELAGGVGSRDGALWASGGAFVQWSLDPLSVSARQEARLRALAAQSRAQGERERAQAEASGGRDELAAAREALGRLARNEELLEEQVQVARGLFRSGVINALQLVEVLSRRLDLLDELLELRLGLLDAWSRVALNTRLKIPGGADGR